MAKIKLTKSVVDSAEPEAHDVELRDTLVPGFLCKVTPAGRKVFMLQYRTNAGDRRKPSLGLFGELTVEQARTKAQNWLAEVRQGRDPGAAKVEARKVPTMKELCTRFMEDHSKRHNKKSSQKTYQTYIDNHIIPKLGKLKVSEVKRADIAAMMKKMEHIPTCGNRTYSLLRVMFNLAEVWGFRPDGTNPCRHVPMYPPGKQTRLIVDDEMVLIFRQLETLEAEGLESYVIPLAIRLQFEFAARMSEILSLQWDWIDFENRRINWPDSKTGPMSKPISEEAQRLLSNATRYEDSPYVITAARDHKRPMSKGVYYHAWVTLAKRAGLAHVGTHGIRHRSATDIANSGVPIKVGMALTAHKTVGMFMRYVHTQDQEEREASDVVAKLRKLIASGQQAAPAKAEEATELPQALAELFKLLKRSPELLEKLEAA